MRRILIEHARKRTRGKRGGKRVRVELGGIDLASDHDQDQILALDDAFQRLEEQDPKAADCKPAQLRYQVPASQLGVQLRCTSAQQWALMLRFFAYVPASS
jgi:hypothetical protein